MHLPLSDSLLSPFPLFLQMSQITIRSPKHCAKQGLHIRRNYKKLFFAISAIVTSFLSLVLLIYFILRPTKPEFSLNQVDVYQFHLSGRHHLLNSSIEITLLSENPNRRVGVYYDELQVYAAYKGQQITADSTLSPFYQGHEDSNLLTASLTGNGLSVAPSFGYEVGRDQTAGRLVLDLKVNGRLRWKVGTWVSRRYRYNVECVAVMAFRPSLPLGPMSSKQGTQCSTSI